MSLEDLGYNIIRTFLDNQEELYGFELGRVTAEHKERYTVKTENGETEAEVIGNLRFTAKSREDFPAVGDWVTLISYEPDFAIINKVLPRYSIIKRQAVGRYGEIQIIGTNIDYALKT
jgi:ribosome biogenesis GTPase